MQKFSEYINEDAVVKKDLEVLKDNIDNSEEADGKKISKEISIVIKRINQGYRDKKYLVNDCKDIEKLIIKAGYKDTNITWKISNIIDFAGV